MIFNTLFLGPKSVKGKEVLQKEFRHGNFRKHYSQPLFFPFPVTEQYLDTS